MRQPHGLFGWVDLTTSDVPAAKSFYEGLFRWECTDVPTPMGPAYTMCRKDGDLVAGIGPMPPGMAEAGMPPMWNSYILVEDVDEVLVKVEAAGGAVVMPAMDVMTEGRMAMVTDPSGAVVGLWQPQDHEGAERYNSHGALTWNELQSRDRDAAMSFYAEVVGWTWEPMDSPGGPEYFVAELATKEGDDKSNAGAMTVPDAAPAEMPSMWFVYFAVDDCDTSVARVLELGGSLFFPAMEMGPGRFAGISDPTGAMFMLGSFPDR